MSKVDGWEKQGIPVSRLSSLDCALNIVEELNRLEEATDKEAMVGSHLGLRIGRNGLEITRVILLGSHGFCCETSETRDKVGSMQVPKKKLISCRERMPSCQ